MVTSDPVVLERVKDARLLGIERDTVTYTHGLSHWEGETFITYPSKKHRQISLKRGVFPGDSQFFDWLVGAAAISDVLAASRAAAPSASGPA